MKFGPPCISRIGTSFGCLRSARLQAGTLVGRLLRLIALSRSSLFGFASVAQTPRLRSRSCRRLRSDLFACGTRGHPPRVILSRGIEGQARTMKNTKRAKVWATRQLARVRKRSRKRLQSNKEMGSEMDKEPQERRTGRTSGLSSMHGEFMYLVWHTDRRNDEKLMGRCRTQVHVVAAVEPVKGSPNSQAQLA